MTIAEATIHMCSVGMCLLLTGFGGVGSSGYKDFKGASFRATLVMSWVLHSLGCVLGAALGGAGGLAMACVTSARMALLRLTLVGTGCVGYARKASACA